VHQAQGMDARTEVGVIGTMKTNEILNFAMRKKTARMMREGRDRLTVRRLEKDGTIIPTQKADAYHETGHAIAALFVGVDVEKVYVGNHVSGGQIVGGACITLGASDAPAPDSVFLRMAGSVAEFKSGLLMSPAAIEEAATDGSSADISRAKQGMISAFTAASIAFSSQDLEDGIIAGRKRAKEFFEDPKVWGCVVEVAELLWQKKELSGEEVKEIYRRRIG